MANQKAQKQTLPFPPLINLADNKPIIDTSLQSYDKINGPFLNNMLQPVWIQDTGSEAVYTKNGNRYEIRGTEVWLNGRGTGLSVGDHYFVKERIDYLKNSLDFALDPNTNDIYDLRYEPGVNGSSAHTVLYKNDIRVGATAALNAIKDIAAARIKVHSSGAVVIAMLINETTRTFTHFAVCKNGTVTEVGGSDIWWRQLVGSDRSVSGANIVIGLVNLGQQRNIDPIVNIGEIDSNLVGISFVAAYGEIVDITKSQFITSILNINTLTNTTITALQTPNSTGAYTYTDTENINVLNRVSGNESSLFYINKDNQYYRYDTETGVISDQVTNFPEGILPGRTNYLDKSNTYRLYKINATEATCTLTLNSSNANGSYTFKAKISAETPNDQIISVTKGTRDADNYITATGTGIVAIEYKRIRYSQQDIPYPWDFSTMSLTTSGQTFNIPSNQMASYAITVNKSYSGVTGAAFLPCIFNDDGNLSALFAFRPLTTSYNAEAFNATYQNAVTLGAYNGLSGTTLIVRPLASSNSFRNSCSYMRSASFVVNQEFAAMTYKLCNAAAATPKVLSDGGQETSTSQFLEATFSNRYGLRYNPGTSRNTRFNYYSYAAAAYNDPALTGNSEDALVFTVQGYRNPIHFSGNKSSPFNILYNTTAAGYAYIQGISYSKQPNALGTLLTPWQSIDENSYVTASANQVIYKDGLSDVWKISIVQGKPPMQTLLDDRYVIFNTTEYITCIDSETGKYYHYATDYNGRLCHGSSDASTVSGVVTIDGKTEQFPHIRYTANGINPLYTVMPRDAIVSMLLAQVGRYRCNIGSEALLDCQIEGDYKHSQGCDVFWSNYSDTRCVYRKTLYGIGLTNYKKELDGLQYPGTTSTTASLTPNIFTRYVNGAGNNDMVIDGYDAFTLSYYDNKPYFIYSRSTQVSTTYDESDSFFVLQGQYYGVINDKLYALVYSGGAIAQMDAVIDIRGLKFLGNNPQIAFFWDPAAKTIKSFTGDGILQAIWDATNLGEVTGLHFYDETTQSIYIPTSRGLLVLGPKNNYMYPNWTNVKNISFDELGTTHITDGDTTINLRYYETEGYEVLPLDIESQFWGDQQAGSISIDNFKISLYDLEDKKPSSYLTVGVRTLTDISVKSEEKTFKITPEMWDKFSKSCLISYNPALIKGQGVRLYLKTPMVISGIVASMNSNVQQTLTRNNL